MDVKLLTSLSHSVSQFVNESQSTAAHSAMSHADTGTTEQSCNSSKDIDTEIDTDRHRHRNYRN